MNKFTKYIIFALFMVLMLNICDAQAENENKITCTYDGEYEAPTATRVAKASYHIVLPASVAGDTLYTPEVKGYFNEGSGLTKQGHNRMKFHGLLKLKGNRCPTIYGYFFPTVVLTRLELYETLELCKSDGGIAGWAALGGNHDAYCKPLATGVYEVKGKKQCTDAQVKQYTKETLEYFKKIDNVAEYERRMDSVNLLNIQDLNAIEKEFNQILQDYTSLFNETTKSFQSIAAKYDCDLSKYILKDLDDEKQIYNTVYYPRLKKYKNNLIDKAIEYIKSIGGDTSVLEEIKNKTDNYANDLKENLNEEIESERELHDVGIEQNVGKTCEGILGNSLIGHIQEAFDLIKIIAPILLILFGSIDYGKAVIANDNDALKKATSNFIKRAIAAVAIFFLPFFINLVLNLPGIKEHIQIDDPLCTVEKVVTRR